MNKHAQNFVDIINRAANSASRTMIFDNFLTCATAVLNRDEQTFQAVSDKQLNLELFAELAAALDDSISQPVLRDNVLGLTFKIPSDDSHKPHYHDVLGEIFSVLELFDQGAGQVFTAQATADILGETAITRELVKHQLRQRGVVTLRENCCGSGALILGGLNALLKLNVNPCRQAVVYACDLDERCIRMTFIQLSLYCIAAVVERRDAITGQSFGSPLETPMFRRLRHEK